MIILITILSIYIFIGLAYFIRRVFSINICSTCVGVSATWIWMLIGIILNIIPDSFILPMEVLIVLSVLGISNKLYNKQYKFWQMPEYSSHSPGSNHAEELKEKLKNCC